MKKSLLLFFQIFMLSALCQQTMAQTITLGTAGDFALFTASGAVTNTGNSFITGDVGTNTGAITGFGNVNGVLHTSDGATGAATGDLITAYGQLNSATTTSTHAPQLGTETLNAGVYEITGDANLNGNLILDAQNNPAAVFIFKMSATFSTSVGSQITLINGAKACNVFWKAGGTVNIASQTIMRGTLVANNGAIDLASDVVVDGRILSTTGAITLLNSSAKIPVGCGSITLTGPAAPGLASIGCYAIFTSAGENTNAGTTTVKGDVGTNLGLTTGYNALTVNGVIHPSPDPSTAAAASDLGNVYTILKNIPFDIELLYPAQFGNDLVLTPHTYLMNASTVLTGTVTLNAEGNADAVFVIQIKGALTTSTYAKVLLTNGTQAKNVYWNVDGAVSIADFSQFAGTVIANNGAINLATGATVTGRVLSTTGAVNIKDATVTSDKVCGLTITPAPFDPCSNFAYQVMGLHSEFQDINLATGKRTTIFTFPNFAVNAMGFNQVDDRLYAIRQNLNPSFTTDLIVIGSDHTYQVLATTGEPLPGSGGTSGTQAAFIGDINANGIMFISQTASLYSINLNPSSGTDYLKVYKYKLSATPSLFYDFGFPAGDNVNAYGVNQTGDLVKINTTTRVITIVKPGVVPGGQYGAVFFDNLHNLYVSENGGMIYKIINTTSATLGDIIGAYYSTADPTGVNDGARCPNASVPVIADFGDAPNSYLTLLASGGPSHIGLPAVPVPIYLGAGLTYDQDGQPSPNADKDVDDGISSFPGLTPSNTYASYSVTVATKNGVNFNAYLNGWIDWNNNGIFDPGEKVSRTITPNTTSVTLTWTNQTLVDVAGRTGTYARFRISSSSPLISTPGGQAPDGEVEDYYIPFYTISGTVYTDANGGTPDGTLPPPGLYAQLVDGINVVKQSVPLNPDGTYQLILLNGVSVQITNVSGTAISSTALPANYVHVSSTDGTPFDGKTQITSYGADNTGIDFGIEQLPNSDDVNVSITKKVFIGNSFILDGRTYVVGQNGNTASVQFPPLSGTDPEDGALGSGKSVKITTVPNNANLYYNGGLVTAGQVIVNYDPSLLSLTITIGGSNTIVFNYAFLDAAGQSDATPATYTIDFVYILPVELASFTARGDNGDAILDWITSNEANSAGFGVEHSLDGTNWNLLAFVNSKSVNGNSNVKLSYQYIDRDIINGTHYYRLKQTDLNGNFVYSDIAKVDMNSSNTAFKVYPNPSNSYIFIEYSGAAKTPVRIIDMNGRVVKSLQTTGPKTRVETNEFPAGTYLISMDGKTIKFTVNR